MSLPRLRPAGPSDAGPISQLHADSWRRHYRGAYSDTFLDGDIGPDRYKVWSSRLASPAGSCTVVAENEDRMVGFVHVILDQDDCWGSLVDNLHVVADRQRTGVGRLLMGLAATAVVDQAGSTAMYLWVLQQNERAQRFYSALGGVQAGIEAVDPPGGVADRLTGEPRKLRIVWPDTASLVPDRELRPQDG